MSRKVISMSRGAQDAASTPGNDVHIARVEHGWTVMELVERIGVSAPTVRALESGASSDDDLLDF